MKPSNSQTQSQTNPRKNRLKVAFGPPFPTANNFSWIGIGFILEIEYKKPNPTKILHEHPKYNSKMVPGTCHVEVCEEKWELWSPSYGWLTALPEISYVQPAVPKLEISYSNCSTAVPRRLEPQGVLPHHTAVLLIVLHRLEPQGDERFLRTGTTSPFRGRKVTRVREYGQR